jgi:flagellar motility protein MotE (MotC chaperone)
MLAIVALVAKLAVSGFYYFTSWQPQAASFPKAGEAVASPVEAGSAALAQAGGAGAAGAGSMLMGAAALFGEAADPALALAAQASIPLPPGDESLRQPQRPAPALPPAAQRQGTQQPAAVQQPTVPAPPPPTAPSGATTEELARREFDLSRRELQLNTREAALREMETAVNARLRDAEAREAGVREVLARNDAILAEQKSLREEQQTRDDALKSERVEHLVAAFKGMKPEQAGNLINSMDDAVAVAILSAMPGSNAGKILAMVSPDKAARLGKAISEQRVDPRVLLESSQVPGV